MLRGLVWERSEQAQDNLAPASRSVVLIQWMELHRHVEHPLEISESLQ